MKYPHYLISVISLLTLLVGCSRNNTHETRALYDPEKFVPTYKLLTPENWTTERFGIPIEFAPSIPYVGIEDVRFAPGWDNTTSDDYWTYSYLWYLQGSVVFDAKTIEENLNAYYTGLVGRNIERRKIPKEKLIPVETKFETTEKNAGDLNTFKGTVHMLDYMTQEPITLNALVHVKSCPGKSNTFVIFEISPKEESHPIWQTLDKIYTEFQCE